MKKKIMKLAISRLPESFHLDKEDLEYDPSLYDLENLRKKCVEQIGVARKYSRKTQKERKQKRQKSKEQIKEPEPEVAVLNRIMQTGRPNDNQHY